MCLPLNLCCSNLWGELGEMEIVCWAEGSLSRDATYSVQIFGIPTRGVPTPVECFCPKNYPNSLLIHRKLCETGIAPFHVLTYLEVPKELENKDPTEKFLLWKRGWAFPAIGCFIINLGHGWLNCIYLCIFSYLPISIFSIFSVPFTDFFCGSQRDGPKDFNVKHLRLIVI